MNQAQMMSRLLTLPMRTINLVFAAIMIGGTILILSSLYLIYDVQVFGIHTNAKTDLMMVSFALAGIHIALSGGSLSVFKKMRYAKSLIQKEKEEIAKIDKAKDEFAAMIAHELKNPLVPIQSYSKMLHDGKFGDLTPVQKEKMRVIISGTDSMLILIQDILDVRKAELGKMQIAMQPADLSTVVLYAIDKTYPMAERRGVTIYNNVTKNIEANIDKHRIEQVLVNLIKNAIDFVPKDTGVILIETSLQDSAVTVSVTDNGCGIPLKELDSLFRKFYQSDVTQNKERHSNGLGLAVCKTIIDLHGGKIWAESQIGKGTSVRFKLPLAECSERKESFLEKIT